jgi:MFS family permease
MTAEQRGPWVLAGLAAGVVASLIGAVPGARLSDVVGRKRVIYGSAILGATGIAVIGRAPVPEVVIAGVALLGLAYGAFLAVDWALMTEIIPKASAGRYMGFSNIVEALNGAIASSIGTFTMYLVGLALGAAIAARTAMLLGVVVFLAGIVLLVPVREPPRVPRDTPAAS